MDISMVIWWLNSWVGRHFPTLAPYTDYTIPILLGVITAFGVFTNWLPAPGHVYPVPDTLAIKAELQGNGTFIMKFVQAVRNLVVVINWFLATAVYAWFYNGTNAISAQLCKIKLAPKPKQ